MSALSERALAYGWRMLERSGGGLRPSVATGNAYERRLLADVVHPEHAGSGFAEVRKHQTTLSVIVSRTRARRVPCVLRDVLVRKCLATVMSSAWAGKGMDPRAGHVRAHARADAADAVDRWARWRKRRTRCARWCSCRCSTPRSSRPAAWRGPRAASCCSGPQVPAYQQLLKILF